MELAHEPINLSEVAVEALKMNETKASEKNIALTCDLDPCLPVLILADSVRIRQIICNLVSNAIKYIDIAVSSIEN